MLAFILRRLGLMIPTVIGLLLAVALDRKMRGRNILRAIFYGPAILPLVAVGLRGDKLVVMAAAEVRWLTSAWESWMDARMAFHAGTEVELMLNGPSSVCQAAMLL